MAQTYDKMYLYQFLHNENNNDAKAIAIPQVFSQNCSAKIGPIKLLLAIVIICLINLTKT